MNFETKNINIDFEKATRGRKIRGEEKADIVKKINFMPVEWAKLEEYKEEHYPKYSISDFLKELIEKGMKC